MLKINDAQFLLLMLLFKMEPEYSIAQWVDKFIDTYPEWVKVWTVIGVTRIAINLNEGLQREGVVKKDEDEETRDSWYWRMTDIRPSVIVN